MYSPSGWGLGETPQKLITYWAGGWDRSRIVQLSTSVLSLDQAYTLSLGRVLPGKDDEATWRRGEPNSQINSPACPDLSGTSSGTPHPARPFDPLPSDGTNRPQDSS